MRRKPTWAAIGSITMEPGSEDHPERLINTLADELGCLMRRCRVGQKDRKRFVVLLRECARATIPDIRCNAPTLIEDLTEALETFAPPHAYFGRKENGTIAGLWADRHADDCTWFKGAPCSCGQRNGEWGFWPIVDDELPRTPGTHFLDAVSEGVWEREQWGGDDCYLVTDHGNVSCGRFDLRGRWHEYWSVV